MTFNRTSLHKTFAVLSIVFAIAGFSDIGPAEFSGLARALGAVFFILFFIFNLLKGELLDEELPKARNNSGCEFNNIREAGNQTRDKLAA